MNNVPHLCGMDIAPEIVMPFDHAAAAEMVTIPEAPPEPSPVEDVRAKIERVEKWMLEQPQVEIPAKHYFAEGLYAREVTIPKGVMATGKIHLTGYLAVIPKGDVTVYTDDGVKRIVGPATFPVKPGMKHIGFAHEDTTWLAVHACEATDPEAAEKELVVDTLEEYALRKGETAWPSLPQQL